MLISDLRLKSDEDLKNLINDLKAELFMLRFKNSTGQLDQPHKISIIKKDIAKVFTVLYEHKKDIKNKIKIPKQISVKKKDLNTSKLSKTNEKVGK